MYEFDTSKGDRGVGGKDAGEGVEEEGVCVCVCRWIDRWLEIHIH